MRPVDPLAKPFEITVVDEEVVFLGEGPSFSMTAAAAQATFLRLARAVHSLAMGSVVQGQDTLGVVLLVEDEALVREIGVTVLEDAGYVVIEACSATQALKTLGTGAVVHLLFTDVQMPGELDGLQLASLVSERWPAIRVLVSSGRARPSAAELPSSARFIAKPYVLEDMLKHVNELVAA